MVNDYEDRREKRAQVILSLTCALLMIGIACAGYVSYHQFEAEFHTQVERQLTTIANLKLNNIINWRNERLAAEAEILHQNLDFAISVQRYFANPHDSLAQAQIQNWLKSYRAHQEYDLVRLLDTKGQTRVSEPDGLPPISAAVAAHIPDVLQSKQVTLVDFYRSEIDHQIHLTTLIPIMDAQTATHVIGLVALRINPFTYLYPSLQQWPLPSKSAETLLVRREEDSFLILNELNLRSDTALTIHYPLVVDDLPPTNAELGQETIIESLDYRGESVLSTVYAVPHSPWFLIAKINTTEVYRPLRERLWQTVLFFITLSAAISAGLLLVWRSQILRYYRKQEQTLDALRASEARFHLMFEAHGAIMLLIEPQTGNIFDANQAAVYFYGYTKSTLCSMNINQINMLSPEQVAAEYKQAANKERSYFTFPHKLADGTERIVEVYSSPISIQEKRMLFSIIHDITERMRAEIALRLSEENYRGLSHTLEERVNQRTAEVQDLYENAPNGYHSLDANGNLTMINQTELTWLGYSREELIGRPFTNFITARSRILFQENYPLFMQRGWVRGLEYEFIRKDGTTFHTLLDATAIYDQQGNYVMSRSIAIDNTERKKAEETLRQANTELARAARTKDEFLANMSHELRTPLNAILGLSEGLLEYVYGPLNERQHDSLNAIESSGRHLLTLINDILDLSKVEAGRLDLQMDIISVADVCKSSILFVKEIAIKKSINIAFYINDQMTEIEADPKRLKQILVNLLSNAVKFTPANGHVSLDVTANAAVGVIHFIVQDTGIGISPEDMAQLFQPFTQLDSSLSRQHEGTGLGLALVRRLTELHGGSVTVESHVGQGSRFSIALPYSSPQTLKRQTLNVFTDAPEPEQQALVIVTHPNPAPIVAQILLVEDNEVNILPINDYLQAKGFHVIIAHNGQEALDLASKERLDLILMDIQMPEMNGLEAIQYLRAKPNCANTPIIALTALAMPGDRERCLAAGANAYLTKPVSLRELVDLISSLLRQRIEA